MTEDELFARRPLGMRMAMVVRQWRAIIDHPQRAAGKQFVFSHGSSSHY